MSVQDTSLLAFIDIEPSLSERQQIIYALLRLYPDGLTNMEIGKHLGWSINRVTPRVFELRSYGLVKTSGHRVCSVTGRNAYAWKVNV